MIELTSVRFAYDRTPAIAVDAWHVDAGSHWLVTGPSGAGKSTLMHVLSGLRHPQQGQVRVAEQVLADLSSAQLDQFRGRHIGMVLQQPHLISAISVLENVMMAPYLAGLPQHADYAKEVLNRLGVGSLARAMPDEISAGQAQRVSIARAVVNAPAVLLADEPTSALDDDHCEEVLDLLFEQAHANDSTLVVVTHDARVAGRFSNRLHFAELGSLPTIHQEA